MCPLWLLLAIGSHGWLASVRAASGWLWLALAGSRLLALAYFYCERLGECGWKPHRDLFGSNKNLSWASIRLYMR